MSDDVISFPSRPDPSITDEGEPAEVVHRRDIRKATAGPQIRARIAGRLTRLAGLIARERLAQPGAGDDPTPANVTGAVVVLLTDAAPIFTYDGEIDWPDIETAYMALRDVWWLRHSAARRTGEEGFSYRDFVADEWAKHRAYEAKREQERQAECDVRPWTCEHCDTRYKTKRGAEQHERQCYRNPQADRYTSGEYRFHADENGKWVGSTLIRQPRDPSASALTETRLACPDCHGVPCWRHVEPQPVKRAST